MDQVSLETRLQDLPLPAIHYFQSIDSTNDEAWRWVKDAAPHAALVIADEQTAGRGRLGRRWITTAGSGLAFSLVLRSPALDAQRADRLTGLAALAVCKALQSEYAVQAQIKWPNDILLMQRKVAGILIESRWEGEILVAAVIGIGINIAPESVNPQTLPPSGLTFPATSLEDVLGHPVDRLELLYVILASLFHWLSIIGSPMLIDEWQKCLAYVGEWVELAIVNPGQSSAELDSIPHRLTGRLVGLDQDGSLILLAASGKLVTVQVGELQLRPVKSPGDMEKNEHV